MAYNFHEIDVLALSLRLGAGGHTASYALPSPDARAELVQVGEAAAAKGWTVALETIRARCYDQRVPSEKLRQWMEENVAALPPHLLPAERDLIKVSKQGRVYVTSETVLIDPIRGLVESNIFEDRDGGIVRRVRQHHLKGG